MTPLERMFRSYDDPVRRRLARCYPRAAGECVDDAMSRAWLIAARQPEGKLDHETADRWLFVVAQHELWQLLRQESRTTELHDDHAALDELDARLELLDVLSAMGRLTDNQRRALVGRMLGLSYRELAEATGHTYTWANRHINEGRARLRQ